MVEPKNREATRYGIVAKAVRGQDFDAESGTVTVAYNLRISSLQCSATTISCASAAIFPSLSTDAWL